MAEPSQDAPMRRPQAEESPSKFISNFFFRSIFVAIFILLLPLFPSQAPEFINHTIFTRSWELLHLLLVGIAVSYGVFSRRNVENEKESVFSKPENDQSYVSKILQVPLVFDDEAEIPSGSDENKVQTWSNQYFRGEPVMVVAKDTAMDINNRPLLRPVRSLKSRISEADMVAAGPADQDDSFLASEALKHDSVLKSTSNSPKKIVRNGSREIGDVDVNGEEKSKGSVVLPSPIPWRSRSGRMEANSPSFYSLPPAAAEEEFDILESPSIRASAVRSSRSNSSVIPSPKKLFPAPSLSPEFHGINGDVPVKKRGTYPPPPPPPPPPFSHKSRSVANSSVAGEEGEKRNFKCAVKELNKGSKEDVQNGKYLGSESINQYDENSLMGRSDTHDVKNLGSRSFRLETKSNLYNGGNLMGRSDSSGGRDVGGRSFRSLETKAKHYNENSLRGRSDSWSGSVDMVGECESFRTGTKNKHLSEGLAAGKSVRTVRASRDGVEMHNGHRSKLLDDELINVPETRVGFNQSRPPPKNPKKKLIDKYVESGDSDSGASQGEDSEKEEETGSASVAEAKPDENVDRKADEFIAKFREQIRLQRIESIKKTAGQHVKRNTS